jgi:hypothetical protein
MTTSIKITSLTNIGANIAYTTLVPVVNMTGTPETQKANLQIVGNLILSGAGGANFARAAQANIALSVANANQPNITSLGNQTFVSVAGNLLANGYIGANGNVLADNLIVTGNVQGNFLIGNGSQITGLQSLQGTQGIQGITGAGTQGVAGSTGTQGVAGSTGIQGVAGSTGTQGVAGSTGIQGVAGSTGTQGVAGSTGIQGVAGSTGIQGIAGSTGTQGIAGSTGTQGIAGSTGIQGIAGSTGIQGIAGSTGIQGIDGIQGLQGIQSVQGLQGLQGLTGAILPIANGNSNINIANINGNVTITSNGAATWTFGDDANLSIPGNLSISTGNIIYTPRYGAFYSNATQSNPIANTAMAMTFNNTTSANGVSVVSNSQLTVAKTGIYNIQFSAQLTKTDGGSNYLEIWLSKNGNTVPWTNTRFRLEGSNSYQLASLNFVDSLTANDYIQLMWGSADLNAKLVAIDAANTVMNVDVPSVIVTVVPVGA